MKIEEAFNKGTKKCYVSAKIEKLLNDLIVAELNASQLYKAMGVWCLYTGYEGFAKYFNKHSGEERVHMEKLYSYSLDRQFLPTTPATKTQPISFSDLKDVLVKALAHEELIESKYKDAVRLSLSDSDITSFTFFQWFLNEQVEEINKFSGLLDRLEIIGNDKKGQFFLDQEMLK